MTILSAQTLRKLCLSDSPLVSPFSERGVVNGMSYGLSPSGYDIRIKQSLAIMPNSGVKLASSIERFCIPSVLQARVYNKSTWARKGLYVFTTILEPGWEGWLTIEMANFSNSELTISAGDPIAQVVFECLDEPTLLPYRGKYQNQMDGPVAAIMEAGK